MCPSYCRIPVIGIPDRFVSLDVNAVIVFADPNFAVSFSFKPDIVKLIVPTRTVLPLETGIINVWSEFVAFVVVNDDPPPLALGTVPLTVRSNKPSVGNSIVTVSVSTAANATVVVNATVRVDADVDHSAVPVIRVLGTQRADVASQVVPTAQQLAP